ncbi:hypothetical protein TPHA_0D04390 [Tetrapisispora phaffii CBS 4417]|uniref:Rho-GAP domain-containing protein n=1 Tax=Tetrapisispora phaffii (strain ATCC 24235 / CBS 4417 / NBRC 1672 / NRRL Y-8282 / UCD 70-5) TaxID=1071381 RepID=G8BRZ8_TETPH|nr:hypothetical protein TPHA_0D04390 [Tetrapisispora phaffii CBS 4417]CCE63073.1 hypothetical protein TPHA_0D04390 [Tetrapisispora phaffii CBS 4417]
MVVVIVCCLVHTGMPRFRYPGAVVICFSLFYFDLTQGDGTVTSLAHTFYNYLFVIGIYVYADIYLVYSLHSIKKTNFTYTPVVFHRIRSKNIDKITDMRGFKWSSRRRASKMADDDSDSHEGNGNGTVHPRSRSMSHAGNATGNAAEPTASKRKSSFLLSSRFSRSNENIISEQQLSRSSTVGIPSIAETAQQARMPRSQPQQPQPQQQPQQHADRNTVVTLDQNNYDNTILKVGWVNRSNGQYLQSAASPIDSRMPNDHISRPDSTHGSTSQNNLGEKLGGSLSKESIVPPKKDLYMYKSNSSGSSLNLNTIGSGNNDTLLVPDYKLYRAQLKGPLLHLYKSGLPNSVKYFDPLVTQPPSNNNNAQTNTIGSATSQTPRQTLSYVNDIFPHPQLKLEKNKDGRERIVSGSLESLCHTVLFWNTTSRNAINLILLLPMLDDFTKSFNYFILYTNHFIAHYHNDNATDEKKLNLLEERISLLIKSIVDLMPSFLLSQQCLNSIFTLIKMLKLENLKTIINNKTKSLNKLVSFKNLELLQSDELRALKYEYFIKSVDPIAFADTFHTISLTFDKVWSPRYDYSLLYNSTYINNVTISPSTPQNNSSNNNSTESLIIRSLNPSVFNNDDNLHILGRIMTSQLFSSSASPKLRAELLMIWIKVGCRLEEIGDLSSWLSIATIICSQPILRLSKTWNFVDDTTIKIVLRDWIPTMVQLGRRQFASKSTNSVFILAPPNLEDKFIRENVISYFGDLTIYADKLKDDIKFKYLEKKINRTKNAFYKWEQRLQDTSNKDANAINVQSKINKDLKIDENVKNDINSYWRYYLSSPKVDINKLMQLSLDIEPPSVDQSIYSKIGLNTNSSILTGSYLPVVFNELSTNFSFFPKKSIIELSAVKNTKNDLPTGEQTHSSSKVPPPRSSARMSKSISISEPFSLMRSSYAQINDDYSNNTIDEISSKQITGFDLIDSAILKNISSIEPSNSKLMRSACDIYNINSHIFRLNNGLIFKTFQDHSDENSNIGINTSFASEISDSTTRFSHLSVSTNNNTSFRDIIKDLSTISNSKDSRLSSIPKSNSIEDLDFLKDITKFSDGFDESTVINTVLKSSSLDKMIDLLVLTITIFSKLVNTSDLKKYYEDVSKVTSVENDSLLKQAAPSTTFGLLDFAFVKLSMDSTLFTEIFFDSYKSFTTTTSLIEQLAKRFIKAKACAYAITAMSLRESELSDTVDSSKFPNWDMTVEKESEINMSFVLMIHLGIMEAVHHLVKHQYSDFADDITCNSTFLDFFKILEESVTEDWPKQIRVIKEERALPPDQIEEIDSVYSKLSLHFNNIKSLYQKQFYRPVNMHRASRRASMLLNSFVNYSYDNFSNSLKNIENVDEFTTSFLALKYNDYEAILNWLVPLNIFISQQFQLVTKSEWITLSQQLEILYNQSPTSLFNYPSHIEYLKLLSVGDLEIEELEIANIFVWLSSVVGNQRQLFFKTIPVSIQLLFKFHLSLTNFFVSIISDPNINFQDRVNRFSVIIQTLNYVRWKNSSIDAFEVSHKTDHDSELSPHIPSFIETAIANALLAPQSRRYETSLRFAHSKLKVQKSQKRLRSICEILEDIDAIHIKLFLEAEVSATGVTNNYCPCPGWLVSSLMDLTLLISNSSSLNTNSFNFDKKRCINNIISNVTEMIPNTNNNHGRSSNFFKILFTNYRLPLESYQGKVKDVSKEEAKLADLKETGLYNEILILEVEKLRREKQKKEMLLMKEHESKRISVSQNISWKNKRNSIIIPSSYQVTANNQVTTSVTNGTDITKRNSVSSSSTRNSIITSNNHSGVSRRLGDFFKSPFSMGTFSSSVSNQSLHSYLVQVLKNDGSLSPAVLPEIELSNLLETKPMLIIKTFEIKAIVPLVNHKMSSSYAYSFKIIMGNGSEHTIQATSMKDMNEWVQMIKTSKRYSFYSQKYKGKTHNKVFGVPLEDICEREKGPVPAIVVKLLQTIEERGLDEIGLYRVPGSTGSITALKNAFDEEGAINNTFTLDDDRWYEINTIAGCFKMYLRELPDSLFTNEKIDDFAGVTLQFKAKKLSEEEYTNSIIKLLNGLPNIYYETMKAIVLHLNTVHKHVSNNRMDASNLAIVFSMSFIDQDNFASSMGTTLGAIQTILQHFITFPEKFFKE